VPPPDEMYETLARKYDGTVSYAFIAMRNRLLKLLLCFDSHLSKIGFRN